MASDGQSFSDQKANSDPLWHTQTHTVWFYVTPPGPLGHGEDAAILDQTIIPKLDITQRWQPGEAMRTWINKQKQQRDADGGEKKLRVLSVFSGGEGIETDKCINREQIQELK